MKELISSRGGFAFSIAHSAVEKKAGYLRSAALIDGVNDAADQQTAVLFLRDLKGWLADVEKARKEVKAPVLAAGKEIDRLADEHCAELIAESKRVNRLLDVFQELERKRVEREAAEREAEIARLAKVEADRIAAAKAAEAALQSTDATDAELAAAIGAELETQEARAAVDDAIRAPLPVVNREEGMRVAKVVRWEVTDIHALYKAAPYMVRLEPNKSVINASITKDTVLDGLKVWEETAVNVRRI